MLKDCHFLFFFLFLSEFELSRIKTLSITQMPLVWDLGEGQRGEQSSRMSNIQSCNSEQAFSYQKLSN